MSFSLIVKSAEDVAAEALAKLSDQFTALVDQEVEARAQALGYNSAASCVGYRDSSVAAWAAEAQAFIHWRDAVWQAAFALQQEHLATGTMPDADTVLAALPAWGG